MQTAEGKLYLFVAINRTSKFAFVQLTAKATVHEARAFLNALVADVPYTIHTILADNGIQFADLARTGTGRRPDGKPPFDRAGSSHGIEHRLTKVEHPGPIVRPPATRARPVENVAFGSSRLSIGTTKAGVMTTSMA